MKKVLKNTIIVLLILTLSASTALLAYLYFFASDERRLAREQDFSGEWTAELSMTDQAAVTALGWLQDIEGVSVSLKDMEAYMGELTVRINLTFEQTARSEGIAEGTFRSYVLPESYEACNQAAYEAFAAAFRALLTERLLMAGYQGSTDEETIEALVVETFGMSTVSYLMSCGPALLPSLEELQTRYDGSGAYEAAEGILTRQFGSGGSVNEKAERYIREDAVLILSDAVDPDLEGLFLDHDPLIFMLQQPQDQSSAYGRRPFCLSYFFIRNGVGREIP